MTSYDIYIFILCLLVFVALTALFTALLTIIVKLMIRIYRSGIEDDKIRQEYEEEQRNPPKPDWFGKIFSSVVCAVFLLTFLFSTYVRVIEDDFTKSVPTLRVVLSESMSFQNKDNDYLFENGLDNQIQMYDLILTHQLPAEDELALYDIVVYESDNGDMIIHRIVGIEEANDKHPEGRYFLMQGDAVKNPDVYPVYYSQMRAIYENERIPFVGSFIAFLQAPAGWLCILLMLFAIVAAPIVEKILERERLARLMLMGLIGAEPTPASQPVPEPIPEPTPEPEPEPVTELDEVIEELELPEVVADVINVEHKVRFSKKEDIRIFQTRLYRSSDDVKRRYAMIDSYLYAIERVRVNYSSKYQTFRIGQTDIAKMTVKGDTIYTYLNLEAERYANSRYLLEDMSHTASFSAFPMLIRVTDDAQVEDVKQLIADLIQIKHYSKKGG